MTTYRHTDDMPEISGFGGDYESACQDMLETGMGWLNANRAPDLTGHGFKDVYGIFVPDSDDAKALSKVVGEAAEGGTGAMHQAVMQRLFWIAKNGWEAYCEEMRKPDEEA